MGLLVVRVVRDGFSWRACGCGLLPGVTLYLVFKRKHLTDKSIETPRYAVAPAHDVLDASPGGGGPRSENRSAAASARWKQKLKDFLNGRPIDPSTCDYVVKFVENEVQKQQEKTEKVVEQHKEKIGELARVKSELTELEEACRRLEEANGVSEERAGRGRTG